MANRLATATSPYLQQHADNPVDWWQWTPEAFAEAERRGVPVFLSVGYAACHWCHVMAHESFEDPATAKLINENFVAIKVDREERPDVDAVYMRATQALTGQGGWPMSVFLTPDRKPFYAGTYFPPQPSHGLPSFPQLLVAIGEAWRDRRDEVLGSAGSIVEQVRTGPSTGSGSGAGSGSVGEDDLGLIVDAMKAEFDPLHAGFGRAPKFPPSMVLEALLRDGSEDAVRMAAQTLDAMARGGIYDQLGGGFARYSVDAQWIVPHFEKMLYDNALLLGVYGHWWNVTRSPLAARVVEETVEWLLREMRTPEGGFAASLDADSLDQQGHLTEGAFYAWNQDQLRQALGPEDGDWAAAILSVTDGGTFEHGLSTLQLLSDVGHNRWPALRQKLLQTRESRPRPGRDDKVVAAWNGWLIESLVRVAMIFERSDWMTAASEASELLWRVHWVDGRLRRTSRDGRVSDAPGILEDYAATAQAFVRLGSALADPRWIDRAISLMDVVEAEFGDGVGGLFDTAADAEPLFSRPQDPTDNATPSGLSSALHAWGLLAEFTGDHRYASRVEQAAATVGELIKTAPRFAGWSWADAVSRLGRRPVEVAIAGEPGDPQTKKMITEAYRAAPAGSVIVAGLPNTEGIPLLADRTIRGDVPTAYVCRGFVCRLPVTTVDELVAELAR